MPSPYHNALVQAFARLGCHHIRCNRGDPNNGYTHIHGPSTEPHPKKCTNHLAVIEKTNGTVAPFEDIALVLGASKRPQGLKISANPLGYSVRRGYGKFGYGFDVATILRKWGTFEAFAEAVATVARHPEIKGRW